MLKKIALISLFVVSITGAATATCLIDFWTENLPLFSVGTSYNFQIDVCCGTAPYTFTVYSGSLPTGLSMNSSGLITGTPTVHNQNDTFCVTVTDAVGCHLTRCFDASSE
jgi:hypothetical protein